MVTGGRARRKRHAWLDSSGWRKAVTDQFLWGMTIESFLWNEGETVFDFGNDWFGSDLLRIGELTTQVAQLSWTSQNSGREMGETYELLKPELGILDPTLFSFTNEGGFDGVFSVNAGTLQFSLTRFPSHIAWDACSRCFCGRPLASGFTPTCHPRFVMGVIVATRIFS